MEKIYYSRMDISSDADWQRYKQFKMKFLAASIFWLTLLLCTNAAKRVKRIVGGVSAAPPPPDDPVVFARLYSRNARIEGFRYVLTLGNQKIFQN